MGTPRNTDFSSIAPPPPPEDAKPLPRPGATDPTIAAAIARASKRPGFRPNGISIFIAIACAGAIFIAQRQAGPYNATVIAFAVVASLAAAALAFLGGFLTLRYVAPSPDFANGGFIIVMVLTSATVLIVRGPFNRVARDQLNNRWPDGAKLLTKAEQLAPPPEHAPAAPRSVPTTSTPDGPVVGAAAPAEPAAAQGAKGSPMIRVYRKPNTQAGATPTRDHH